jgi:hypothetical protein
MADLSWMDGMDMTDMLDSDSAIIVEYCGIGTMKSLWQNLPSMSLYISTKPISSAKRSYIKKHYDGTNIKHLARQLEVSEKFVNDAIDEKPKRITQASLF